MSVRTQLTLDTDLVDIGELLKQKLEEALKKVGRVNVVIAGRSGVGKSTLINEVFQGRLATTGQGRPVTTEIREYTKGRRPSHDLRYARLGAGPVRRDPTTA
jgi:predicted GTPase